MWAKRTLVDMIIKPRAGDAVGECAAPVLPSPTGLLSFPSPPPLPGAAAPALTLPKPGKCMLSLSGSPRSVTVGCGYSWGCPNHISARPARLGPLRFYQQHRRYRAQEPSRGEVPAWGLQIAGVSSPALSQEAWPHSLDPLGCE